MMMLMPAVPMMVEKTTTPRGAIRCCRGQTARHEQVNKAMVVRLELVCVFVEVQGVLF
jgi:hypothetical protein